MTYRHRCQHNDGTGSTHQASTKHDEASYCWITWVSTYLSLPCSRNQVQNLLPPDGRVSQTLQERRDASLTDPCLNARTLTTSDNEIANEKRTLVLYLAYGSNLCKETFREKRGINPLSQINVVVPSLRLIFDLPGVPYTEPCFGNSAIRDPSAMNSEDYYKDRWKKGLVGCVFEVTPSDYAHIIATEGGGAGYQDVLVDCHPLPDGDIVPEDPTTPRFVAHTLFTPSDRLLARPDPSYAQPSARYLNLINTGAAELSLPHEYRVYLDQIRTYTITTKRQQMGKVLFTSIWWPFLQLLLALNAHFQDEKGRSPPWSTQLAGLVFLSIWRSYDGVFKKAFGDGERTEEDKTQSKLSDELCEGHEEVLVKRTFTSMGGKIEYLS